VLLGFPFESVTGIEARAAVMGRVIDSFGIVPPEAAMILEAAAGQQIVEATPRSGPGQLVKRGPGTVILTVANTHAGGTVVEAGELVIRNLAALGPGPLEIRSGASVTLEVGSGRIPISSLVVAATGTLDVGTGSLLLAPGGHDLQTVLGLVRSARSGGNWTGPGITSRNVRTAAFREIGTRPLADGSLIVGYAAVGDANLDGSVNIQDLIALTAAGKYGTSATNAGWWEGDFNGDGRVDIGDLIALVSSGLYGSGFYRL